MARTFQKAGIVGVGTMGAGIAEVLARAGVEVAAVEVDDDGVKRGREHIEHSTERAVRGGKITDDERAALLARIHLGTDLSAVADAEIVIEAIPEQLQAKQELFRQLDDLCAPTTILATNTSALSVTELAAVTRRPSAVIGMHWFNPAPVMGLVEIVSTVMTDDQVTGDVQALIETVGKTAVTAGDRAGFIANALLFPYLNAAVRMLESRYATREDIDAAMRFGCGHPMGPLAVLDLIGLDSAYEILDTIYHQSRDHLHAPAPLLKQLVTAGMHGRKTGRGFYTYAAPDSSQIVADTAADSSAPATPRPVSKVGVIGTGTMATGIAEVLAKAGYDVVLRARGADKAASTLSKVMASLDKAVARGKLAEGDRDAALGRIVTTTELDDLASCDLVIEAVVEELGVKRALFAALDEVMKPGAVLASTTSSLPVIECATATSRPADVVGMHWFNPAPAMKLIEVVPTVVSSPDAVATVREVALKAGKAPVSCGDRAGFIVNALLFPYLNGAARMLEQHYATADDIDAAMKVGCGHPMGPFELMDVVGLDVTLAIQQTLYLEFREPGDAPAPLLEHLVKAGYLGRKTKRGFRDYSRR
jgi:3-hydroxybutyryl-CoA dehydrogenase